MGIEHGIGEVLQGSIAPAAVAIESWPDSELFSILAGEPAMTVVPNLLAAGLLSIAFSLLYLLWATVLVERANSGMILIVLAVVMLLVGAGFSPPVLGIVIGAAATRINAPLRRQRARPSAARHILAKVWPWAYGACLAAWLFMFPGVVLLWHFFGVDSPTLIYSDMVLMLGLLFLTIFAAFAHDAERLDRGVERRAAPGRAHVFGR